jgi:16S rRNA C967 or C1407 C5-methylase (RsmB/RsmF family)
MQEMGKLPFPSLEGDDERSRARALATIHSHPVVSSVFGINFLSIAELHAKILFLTFWVSQWMVRRWMAQFGEGNTVRLMECNNRRPIFALRANSAQGVSRTDLTSELEKLEVAHVESPYLQDFVRVSIGMQVGTSLAMLL